MSDFTNPIFTDEDKAREHLESLRWSKHRSCPHCGEFEHTSPTASKNHKSGLYVCLSCKQTFTVTVGTLFERSHVPLNKWMHAFYLMSASKKGISSKQLERMLEVTYKTAWFMSHRIREAMRPEGRGMLGGGGQIIEADETFIGRKPGTKKGHGGYAHKEAIFSLVERNGTVRSFHVNDVTGATLKAKLKENVSPSAKLMTDDFRSYRPAGKEFASHEVVKHSLGEYVRGDVHTNTIEGFFSIFKRGMYGVYQHVSSHHLNRYTTEFDFRYNHREKLGYSDTDRAEIALKGVSGKRLTYRRTGA